MPQPDEDEEMPDASHVSGTTANGQKAQGVQSSYVQQGEPAEARTPAPPQRRVSANATKQPQTPATSESRSEILPPSTKRKAAERAAHKLHTEVIPDALQWEKEKHRKRIPEESPSHSEGNEKRRKLEKQKSEEKENIIEGVPKKVKKEAEVKERMDTGEKITLLITGANHDQFGPNAVKVGLVLFLNETLTAEIDSTGDQSN